MMKRLLPGILAGGMIAMPAAADDDRWRCRLVGTWLVSAGFPDMNLHFQQLLLLDRGGTLTETNNTLHANALADPISPMSLAESFPDSLAAGYPWSASD